MLILLMLAGHPVRSAMKALIVAPMNVLEWAHVSKSAKMVILAIKCLISLQ